MKIGLISDTHGLLRPEVFRAFEGVDHILHAGDVGSLDLLLELEAIAPVTAVWGNTDGMEVRARLPESVSLELGGMAVAVLHGHQYGRPGPAVIATARPDAALVVFGHTHRPVIEKIGDILVINPGSAGPRRFSLPVTVAIVTIQNGGLDPRLVHLVTEER